MFQKLALAAAAALGFASAAPAATVTYATLAAYNAAVGGSTVAETFTGNVLNGTAISQITGAHQFSGNRIINAAGTNTGLQSTTVVLSTAAHGFAMTVANLGGTEMANVLLDGVLAATLPGGSTFFGIVTTRPFTTITFVDATRPAVNTQFAFDNVRVAAVPLAAAAPLLIGGIAMLAGAGRRRRTA